MNPWEALINPPLGDPKPGAAPNRHFRWLEGREGTRVHLIADEEPERQAKPEPISESLPSDAITKETVPDLIEGTPAVVIPPLPRFRMEYVYAGRESVSDMRVELYLPRMKRVG